MYKCEEIFSGIVKIQEARKITLAEAVVEYAEQADCDVEDVVKALDNTAIARIKNSLKCSDSLKPSMRGKPSPQLVF
jgi:hypothetical protein